MPNGKGERLVMEDGSSVQLRPISGSDGTPAVGISSKSQQVKTQRIHFISIEQAEKEKNAKKNNKA